MKQYLMIDGIFCSTEGDSYYHDCLGYVQAVDAKEEADLQDLIRDACTALLTEKQLHLHLQPSRDSIYKDGDRYSLSGYRDGYRGIEWHQQSLSKEEFELAFRASIDLTNLSKVCEVVWLTSREAKAYLREEELYAIQDSLTLL